MTGREDRGIRLARPADLDMLVDLHRAFCDADRHPFDVDRARTAFGPLLRDDRWGAVWLAAPDAGYAVLTWGWSIEAGGAEAVLDELFVRDRRHGIGSALIEQLVDDGRLRGLVRIFLETESHNDGARSFYGRHGFTVDDSIWMSRELT